MAIQSNKNIKIEKELRTAIENKEFTLHYQPKIDLKTDQVIGNEALIRRNHPEMGYVSPAEFSEFIRR